jgi:YggT family protein
MFVLGNILIGLALALGNVLWLYQWILIARAIVSWVNADPRNRIVQFLAMVTDPVVERARRLLPMKLRYFPLDLAFLLVIGMVLFLRVALVQSLADLGQRLRGQPPAVQVRGV